jgi:hypothetical protein
MRRLLAFDLFYVVTDRRIFWQSIDQVLSAVALFPAAIAPVTETFRERS